MNGQTSNLQPIKLGAPQKSCLCPMLSLIYINDLSLKLISLAADMNVGDTSISYSSNSISSINNVVNKDVDSLKTWLEENKLSLKVAKTHYIYIGSRNKIRTDNQPNTRMPSIFIGDYEVSPITSIRYLRV